MVSTLNNILSSEYACSHVSSKHNTVETWTVALHQLKNVLTFLKYKAPIRFEMLFDLSAIDESQRNKTGYTVFYHLISITTNYDIRLQTCIPDDKTSIPSITDLWPSANWYEREVFDMFGLRFDHHPNLKRILLPDYWQGYPLRKSYPYRATDMAPPFDLNSQDYQHIMDSYTMPDDRKNDEENTLLLNIGPNHPGTHGIIRLMVKMRGEKLLHIEQEIGYHHRGVEKLAERHTYHNYIPYTDRVDYLGGVAGELPYLLAIEKLINSTPPLRATIIRVLLTEFFRLSSHLVWLGSFGHDVGAMGPAFYCFKVRENIFDFIEYVTGGRMHPAFFRIGGIAKDLPTKWKEKAKKAIHAVQQCLPELEKLTLDSKLFQLRTKDIGVVTREQAIDWGFTGANLRASGLDWDLRKKRPYCGYEEYDFDIPTASYNDCFHRVKVRFLEMNESIKIINQAIKKLSHIKSGDIQDTRCQPFAMACKEKALHDIETLIQHFVMTGKGIDMPAGESFFATETSKGMTGYYIISHGQPCPYRVRIRTPSFPHFQSVKAICEGDQLGNLIPYISSIDYVLADLDR